MERETEYYWNGSYVTFFSALKDNPSFVVVRDSDGTLEVAQVKDLKKKEESYSYIQAQKRADEIRQITAKAEENLDKVADKVVDKALKALASRMKMNILFGKDGGAGAWALTITTELEKMVKEDAKKTLTEKEMPF